MLPRNNPWKSYRQVAAQTASPGQLVLMLFDGAIKFLEHALLGFQHEDPQEFNQTINNNVLRAQAIINELNYSLNMEQGGEFAMHLRRLYYYCDRRLHESNLHKTPEGIQDCLKRVQVLRDSWSQMLQKTPVSPEITSVNAAA